MLNIRRGIVEFLGDQIRLEDGVGTLPDFIEKRNGTFAELLVKVSAVDRCIQVKFDLVHLPNVHCLEEIRNSATKRTD